jgi:hypothetical protein
LSELLCTASIMLGSVLSFMQPLAGWSRLTCRWSSGGWGACLRFRG